MYCIISCILPVLMKKLFCRSSEHSVFYTRVQCQNTIYIQYQDSLVLETSPKLRLYSCFHDVFNRNFPQFEGNMLLETQLSIEQQTNPYTSFINSLSIYINISNSYLLTRTFFCTIAILLYHCATEDVDKEVQRLGCNSIISNVLFLWEDIIRWVIGNQAVYQRIYIRFTIETSLL